MRVKKTNEGRTLIKGNYTKLKRLRSICDPMVQHVPRKSSDSFSILFNPF